MIDVEPGYGFGEAHTVGAYNSTIIGGSYCIVGGTNTVVINSNRVTVRGNGCVIINCRDMEIMEDCAVYINNSKVENGAALSFLLSEWMQEEINKEDY